jgi:hypothetical protein
MDRERDRPQEVVENRSEAQKRWEEPRLTTHGDFEKVTGQGLLASTSQIPPDPGGDF